MADTKQEVTKPAETEFKTQLSVMTEKHMGVIKKQMLEGGAEFDAYSGKCVMAAMSAINNMIHNQGIEFKDLNQSNLTEILLKVATMKLNANAVPRECYFQVRNVNVTPKAKDATWEKQIEFGIEGDGNDAILARYGRDVEKVHQYWLVRSGDKFTYPKYNGLQMTAPQWEPTGSGDVVRVVYPIVKKGNVVEFHIGERRDVLKSLYAHISNNLMNETFGIVTGTKKDKYSNKEVPRTRYDATEEEKKKIVAKKKEIMKKAKDLDDIDEILDNEELSAYISPAWTEPQSRESMIIRKMRNAVVKKIPKDFGSAIAAEQYNMMDETYKEVHAEIEDHANSVVFDTTFTDEAEPPQAEPVEEKPQEKAEATQKESVSPTENGQQIEFPDWMQ